MPVTEKPFRPHWMDQWAIVPNIEPVDGWQLRSRTYWNDEALPYEEYIAVRDGWERDLNHCRFRFTPNQARFAFLIRNPNLRPNTLTGVLGTWDDTSIEAAMAAELVAA